MKPTSPLVSPQLWKRTMKSNGDPVLILSIRRPSFPESGKCRRIERYFSQLARRWQTRWEADLYPKACQSYTEHQTQSRPFLPWQVKLDYEITFWQPPLISIRLEIQEQDPSALPCFLHIGEVWDTAAGYPRSLRSFLPETPRLWKRELMKQLAVLVQQQLDSGESLLRPDCFSDVKQKFDSERFYLTEEGIVIYYPLYALGPYGEGIPTFTIPISEQVQSNKLRALSSTAQR